MVMDEMFKDFEFNEKPQMFITEVNGIKLPNDYIDFMKEHDGGEGPIGDNNYGRLYMLEELEEINNEYEVQGKWPGYVVIGGIDSNLWAYNPEKNIYCQIDLYGTGEETYYTISSSFKDFLKKMDEELNEK